MKKILSNVYMLAALFMIGAAITSCSKSDDTPAPEPKPVGPTTYTMTIQATKGGDAKTRALTPDGSAINATWTEGDVVVVYEGETELGTLKAQDLTDGNTKCTLKGTNIQAPTGSSVTLTLKYQGNPNYSSQGGTIAYISANCDYAKADVEVTVDKDKKRIIGSGADFVNQQAIVKFTLKEGEALLSPGALKVQFSRTTEPANTVTVTLSDISSIYSTNGNGVVYVATPGNTYDVVTLNATMDNTFYTDTYSYTKTGATFANNYYAITVKMVKNFNPYKTPLTFQSRSDYNTITVKNIYYIGNNPSLQYSLNGGEWTDYDVAITLSNNDIISFRGTTVTYNNPTADNKTTIHSSYNCYVYGNIMSLLDPDTKDFSIMTVLPYSNTFENLFYESTFSHKEGWDLVLPATTLTNECYQQMFTGSSNLDRAPDLPATVVPNKAYANMFGNCSSLKYIKCLATYLGTNSTDQWVVGVPTGSDGTFVRASDTQTTWGAQNDYCGIPSGWSVTTE